LEKDPKNAQAFYFRGLAYQNLGGWDKAIEDLQAYLELDPSSAQGRKRLEDLKARRPGGS
jgi:regulator of sirC expression with transglutaminase-like and TPR domain